MIEQDYLEGSTEEQRKVFLKEVKKLVKELKKASCKAKALDWFLSGDTGFETCLEEFKEFNRQKKFD
jgi:hypothetical protein